MGESFYINKDGSVTKKSLKKTVRDIDWIDFKMTTGKDYTTTDMFNIFVFLIPINWPLLLIAIVGNKIQFNVWWFPFESIVALQDTSDSIKIYCNKNGKLGLYEKKVRLTQAFFDSVEQPVPSYPAYILGYGDKFCLYNNIKRKFLFLGSNKITYIGENTVLVEKNNKSSKYSLIGMHLD